MFRLDRRHKRIAFAVIVGTDYIEIDDYQSNQSATFPSISFYSKALHHVLKKMSSYSTTF